MTFAIHQPNYIPYLGYFYKMAYCDVFVFLDTVQYPRGRSFAARNRIKTPDGAKFLSIPISKPSFNEQIVRYTDIKYANTQWKNTHLKTLEMNYARANFSRKILELYNTQLHNHNDFTDCNINLIKTFATYLGITTSTVRLSSMLKTFGAKSMLIIDIAKQLGADCYLSGMGGGKDYNDEKLLNEHGIQLKYSNFIHTTYPQLWGSFLPQLSIIDLLFNCGPESRTILLGL